jgi:hypothetical protein
MNRTFPLGQIVATPGSIELLSSLGINPASLISRHARGDSGDLDPDDRRENEESLRLGYRLLSSYNLPGTDEKVWVITEADRSVTTLLWPRNISRPRALSPHLRAQQPHHKIVRSGSMKTSDLGKYAVRARFSSFWKYAPGRRRLVDKKEISQSCFLAPIMPPQLLLLQEWWTPSAGSKAHCPIA